jgi:hypothetical protein
LDALNALIPNRLVSVTSDSVRAQLNRKGNTLHCHVINKDREESGFRPQIDSMVRIALPSGPDLWYDHAIYMSPDLSGGAPALLPLTRRNGAIEVTIPELRVYGVLEIPATG